MIEQNELIPLQPGEKLRQERERNGVSLEDAAKALRISTRVLQAIEAGRVEGIPVVYLRGYIQNYARFLSIPDEESRQFISAFDHSEPEVQTIFPGLKRNPADRYLKAFSYVLASLLIGTLAWQVTHEAVRLSQGRTVSAVSDAPGNEAGALTVEKESNTYVNASIASLENFGQRYSATDTSAAEQAWSALDGSADGTVLPPPEVPDGQSLLTLAASADSWVEIIDAKGERLEMDLVRGGSQKHYVGTAPFSVLLGRSMAIDLSLDGIAVELETGTDGDATQITVGNSGNVAQKTTTEPPRD
jgi:cytoskeleton protein RodZ